MRILAKRVSSSMAVLAMLGGTASAQAPQAQLSAADRQALAEFEARVTQYASLRDELDEGAARQRETTDPAKIAAAREMLAAKIRARRNGAKPGDIFTTHIRERFRKILAPEFAGTEGRNTKGSIKDEAPPPGSVKLAVNAQYPKDQPLGTVPPNILAALPKLPEGLEFRFIDRYLALRDAEANLIVDYMPAAIPAK